VESVLREYFKLEEDGRHQARCDREIEKASTQHSVNRELGKLGGRPRKTESVSETKPN